MPQEPPQEPPKRGTFARVECNDCSHEQVVFGRSATAVTCQVCGSPLATPTGGITKFEGTFKEYVDAP